MRLVNGRSTIVRSISEAQAKDFISSHHRQGWAVPGKNIKSLGLFAEEELLAAAVFCNPRTDGMQRRYTSELFRLAFKTEVRVRGGASKLIKAFLSTEPWDLFTYQDTSKEASSVYEYSGLNLVGPKFPKKKILVRNGLTSSTTSNNRSDWFSMEQAVSRGPDRLIGTNLGQQLDEQGRRKSNVQLFLENGYHVEEVPGDRIYEWRNPKVGFYTYKISSSKDDGYYFGRRVIRGDFITKELCASDGYMGSGGLKFQGWVAKVGSESLCKEVLGIYETWEQAVKAETKLIGNLYRTDENCKNWQPGGTGMAKASITLEMKECPTHGLTKHRGKSCGRCESQKSFSMQQCEIHGLVKHRKGICVSCTNAGIVSMGECEVHGLVKFQGSRCASCTNEALVSLKICATHGMTKHRGNKCYLCTKPKLTVKFCSIHGESSHKWGLCLRCEAAKRFTLRECEKHGMVIHRGTRCVTCSNTPEPRLCSKHGEPILKRGKCQSCKDEPQYSQRKCPHHGITTFQRDSCVKCAAEKNKALAVCSKHGETLHVAGVCLKCRTGKATATKDCPIHGSSYHRGDKCMKCSAAKRK